jgi:hypothetical protein
MMASAHVSPHVSAVQASGRTIFRLTFRRQEVSITCSKWGSPGEDCTQTCSPGIHLRWISMDSPERRTIAKLRQYSFVNC